LAIVTVAFARASVEESGLERVTKKVSSGSKSASPLIEMGMVAVVAPAGMRRFPLLA